MPVLGVQPNPSSRKRVKRGRGGGGCALLILLGIGWSQVTESETIYTTEPLGKFISLPILRNALGFWTGKERGRGGGKVYILRPPVLTVLCRSSCFTFS